MVVVLSAPKMTPFSVRRMLEYLPMISTRSSRSAVEKSEKHTDAEDEDALKPRRLHAQDLRALQILPKQHTKIGRRQGVGRVVRREINPAIGSIRVDRSVSTCLFACILRRESSSFPGWLMRLMRPPRREEASSLARSRMVKVSCGIGPPAWSLLAVLSDVIIPEKSKIVNKNAFLSRPVMLK